MPNSGDSPAVLSVSDPVSGDLSQTLSLQGRDKKGRRILRVLGKCFPARVSKENDVRRHLEERIFPELKAPFVVVYVHTCVQRSENFPGVAALRGIFEAMPAAVREELEAVYFVHPGLQARLFLATIGRFLFSSGLYEKVKYVGRLEFLWEHMRKRELEIPHFVRYHDEELERRPLMDYGIEANHHRAYFAGSMDSAASMHTLRCIS